MHRTAILIVPASLLIGSAEPPDRVSSNVNYTRPGSNYLHYNGIWSAQVDRTLSEVADPALATNSRYWSRATFRRAAFPDRTLIEWRMPAKESWRRPGSPGVYGFLATNFGNYDGGRVPRPVTPRRVKDIRTLVSEVRVSLATAHPDDVNILHEFYLTRTAGHAADKVLEIGMFLHPSAAARTFHGNGQSLGTCADGAGGGWTIARTGTYVTLLDQDGGDRLHGRIDWRRPLACLMARKVVSGAEWFNGIALGVEPVRNDGRLRIARWHMTYR